MKSDSEPGHTAGHADLRGAAAAVAGLAADPTRRAAMGAAGRVKAARDFDERKSVEITLAVYEQLLGPRAAKLAS